MRAAQLIARRSRVRAGLLLALAGVTAVVTFLLVGSTGYLAGPTDTAVRQALTAQPPTSAAVQLKALLASDPQEQADAVGQLVATTLTDATTHRTVRSTPVDATVNEAPASLILLADVALSEHVTLIDGAWPASADELSLQADAAEELGIEPGDTLTVAEQTFTLAATWRANDPTATRWFADPAIASGHDGLSLGPVVLDERALSALPVRSYALWTVIPSASTAQALSELATRLDALNVGVERFGGSSNLELSGALAERVTALQRSVGVAAGLVAVPLALICLIGLIALAQLARLLAASRRSELSLLRARGASVLQLTVLSALEAAAAAGAGAVVGATLVALAATTGVVATDSTAWPLAAAIAGAAVLLCGLIGGRAAATAVGDRGESGRATSAATIAVTVLVLVAAGVSLWQFKLYGSPLVADSTGTPRVDPLTVLAPALTLLALATLGLLAFGPGARLLQALTVRRDSILPVLAGWQVARRVGIFGAAVLLLTVSVGGTTAAAVYSQTWSTAQLNAAQQANGSAIRVMLSPGTAAGGDPVTAEPYLHLSGADAAATVLTTPARIADETVSFTALAADNVTAVMNQVGGAVGTQLIASAISGERAGSPLGEELTVAVTANAPADQRGGRIEVSAWVDDEDGSLALLRLGTVELIDAMSAGGAVSGHLPDGVGEWQLIALQATLAGADGARGIDVTLDAEGTEYPLALSSAQATKRATSYDETGPLPVVVTRALAERFALDNGTVFDLRLPNTASVAEAVVTGLVDAIPGATGTRAVVADLPSLNRHLLPRSDRMPQPNEVWIVPEPRADLVRPAVEVSRTSATVTTVQGLAANPVVAPAITVLWWGVAGALLLAIIAVAAITRTFLADRRQEVIVLRALGLSPSEQARVRLLELAGVLGGALVLGLISGGVASVLTVTELATTSTGLATPVHLRFDVLGWVTLIFATIAAVVTISFGYAGRVGSQARDREYREETR